MRVLFLFVITGFTLYGQESVSSQEFLKQYIESVHQFDFKEMRNSCSEDFRLIESSGIYSLDDYIGFLEPDVGKLTFKNTVIILYSKQEENTAWVTYDKETKIQTPEKEIAFKTRETALMTKTAGQWKLRFIHTTHLKN